MQLTANQPRTTARSAIDLLNEIRQPVLVGLSKTLRRSLAGTIDDLLERLLQETSSWERRQAIDDALDLLRNGREGIELRFDRACAESWAERTGCRPTSASTSAGDPGGEARPGTTTLALVDDAAITDQMVVGRVAARSRRRLDEEQVDGLRARFGLLLGRDWFADNEHPVAPDLVFESLRRSLSAFGQARVVQFLLEAFEPRMSADLSTLYADLNQRLVRMGVMPEIRYQISKPIGRAADSKSMPPVEGQQVSGEMSGASEPSGLAGSPGAAGFAPGPSGNRLHGQAPVLPASSGPATAAFAAAGEGPAAPQAMAPEAVGDLVHDMGERVAAAQGSAARYLADPRLFASPGADLQPASERLLAALSTLQAAPTSGQDVAAQVGSAKAVSSAVAREHGSPLERLIIETVSLVFEHVYEDPEIADAIKQQLLRLQVAAFKAALIDPSFFARPDHPMRRFIDRLAEIGSDADFEKHAGSPLVADIAELVGWVLASFERDLATLEEALGRIDAVVEAEVSRRGARLARIAAAAQKAEALERARARVREELSSGFTPETPAFVCQFVCDSWAEVVSRIATGAEFAPFDVQRARRAIDLLLWSVTPKSPAEIPTLAAELPQLIADLSRGLSFIALSGAERELFFSELLAWHGAAIDDAKRAVRRTSSAEAPAAPVPAVPAPAAAPAAAPAMPQAANQAANKAANKAAIQAAVRFESTEPASPVATDDDVARLGLTNGTEVEVAIAGGGEPKRFKVGWMSPSRNVFIFSRYPRDHWTVRRPMLNDLLAQGRIRLVERAAQTRAAIESLQAR